MEVLISHEVTDDRQRSTDWTAIGERILEAATLATAIHLNALTPGSPCDAAQDGMRDREKSDGNRMG
jgi:hypothetical protein